MPLPVLLLTPADLVACGRPVVVLQTTAGIEQIMEFVSASDLIVRPITNWYAQFLDWNSSAANIINPCIHTTCTDCQLPLNASFTFAQQVCFFLYAIPLSSKCCQEFGFCGAQYAPDVKLLWEYNEHAPPAVDGPASFCYSGPKQPIAVMHSRLRTESIALRVQKDFIHTMQATQKLVSKYSTGLPEVRPFRVTIGPLPYCSHRCCCCCCYCSSG